MTFWSPIEKTSLSGSFGLTAVPKACVGEPGREFLMGGVAMAAAIEAAERFTGLPLLYASIQFLSVVAMGDQIDIKVERRGGGRRTAQVGISLTVDGRLLQHVSAALGGRDHSHDRQFVQMPDVRPPEDCPLKEDTVFSRENNLKDQFERRTALEDNEIGLEYVWIRPVFDADISAALLGVVSDFILGAHPRSRGGTSLDNTLRIFSTRQTEWILCATQISGFSNGATVSVKQQFSQNGDLLATSSQTGLLPNRSSTNPREPV